MGSTQAAIAVIGGLLGALATAIGIIISIQNYRAKKRANDAAAKAEEASLEAKEEAANLRERAGFIEALQKTVTTQQEAFDSMARGLKECIVRDNQKAIDIAELQQKDYAKALEIDTLRRRVAALEAR